jgi:hypothetical protein
MAVDTVAGSAGNMGLLPQFHRQLRPEQPSRWPVRCTTGLSRSVAEYALTVTAAQGLIAVVVIFIVVIVIAVLIIAAWLYRSYRQRGGGGGSSNASTTGFQRAEL